MRRNELFFRLAPYQSPPEADMGDHLLPHSRLSGPAEIRLRSLVVVLVPVKGQDCRALQRSVSGVLSSCLWKDCSGIITTSSQNVN